MGSGVDEQELPQVARYSGLSGNYENLRGKNAIYFVSVGKDNFSGEKLIATLKLMNQTLASCKIIVACTLQRFNFMIEQGLDEVTAKQRALEAGNTWVSMFEKAARSHLKIPYTISRWDEWLTEETNFSEILQEIEIECQSDGKLYSSLNESREEYKIRLLARAEKEGWRPHNIEENINRYLKEEGAVKASWPKFNYRHDINQPIIYHHIVYPGKATALLAKTREIFVAPEYPEHLHWLKVGIKTDKHTQEFSSSNVSLLTEELSRSLPNASLSDLNLQFDQNPNKNLLEAIKALTLSNIMNAMMILPGKEQRLSLAAYIVSNLPTEAVAQCAQESSSSSSPPSPAKQKESLYSSF